MRPRRQAKLQTQLRYGSEGAALRQLLREEDAALQSGLRFEEGAAAAIIAAAMRARKPVKRAYRESGRERDRAYGRASSDLGGLSPAADPFRAGLGREFALTRSLMGRERANALGELQSRRVEARAGQTFAQRNLRAEHGANVGKVRLRQAELRRERGAFKAATYADLLDAQRKFRLDKQRARETARSNRADEGIARQREARQQAEADRDAKNGGLTPAERRQRKQNRREWEAGLRETRTWYRRLQKGGNSLKDIRDLLTTGGKLPGPDGATIEVPKLAEYVPRVHREFKRKRKKTVGGQIKVDVN